MSRINGFGQHLMLDLSECDFEALSSIDTCFTLLNKLPDHIGMTKITQPYVFPYQGKVPEDEGITGMVIIAESHLSVHTFPKKAYAFIDVFSCNLFDTDFATQFCIDLFGSKSPEVHCVERGKQFIRHNTYNLQET